MPGVVGVYTAADLELGALAVRLADHRGHQGARCTTRSRPTRSGSTGTRSPSSSRRRASRRIDAAEAVAVDGDGAPRRDRHRGGREGRGDRPRRPRDERRRALEPRRRRRPVGLRLGAGDRAGAVRPAAPDPERDRAARMPRVRRAGRWTSGRSSPRRRSRTSRRSRSPGPPGSPSTSCGSSRRTSAAGSDRS